MYTTHSLGVMVEFNSNCTEAGIDKDVHCCNKCVYVRVPSFMGE